MMWDSLSRLKALPPETVIYCAHEYTAANAKFAVTVDPENGDLTQYAAEVTAKRSRGEWTVPTVLSRELDANPFLRADNAALQQAMGHPGDPVSTFAEIRQRKDNF
jgi:hydroxyacylglutathione hydrolase